MGRLDGKRAIVTGAASGIGRASAVLFAAEGAQVIAADVAADGLGATVALIEKAGGEAHGEVVDSSDEAAVSALVDSCAARFGRVDVMFANAGISGDLVELMDLTAEHWRRVLEVNLIGPFLAIKHAARVMRSSGGGSIICTASVAGLRSGAGASPYSASKAGVINLVQTAAQQLTGTGIRVNAICPGLIETGMTQPMFDLARAAGKERKIGQLNPLRRAGQPHEIAEVALFLASDASSYVNGHALVTDGGLSSSLPFVPGRMA